MESLNTPLFRYVRRVLFVPIDHFPLSRQWTLYKGTLLLVELAQDTQCSALVYHAPALPPPASVTRTFSPRTDVRDRTVGRGGFAGNKILFPWRELLLLAWTSSGDRHRRWAWHSRLYSQYSRHIAIGRHKQCTVDKSMLSGEARRGSRYSK